MKMDAHRRFFLVAALVVLVAALKPFDSLAPGYAFSTGMARHLVLQLIVPALFLLSLPLAQRPWPALDWLLKRPLAAWLIGLGAMWLWHAPALCNAAARNPWLHGFEVGTLLVLGTIFWLPILGPWLNRRLPPLLGIVYLFTACLGCTVLGILITFAPPGLYTTAWPGMVNQWQYAAQADQRVGGLLMWVPACMIYITGIMGLLARWYGAPEIATLEPS